MRSDTGPDRRERVQVVVPAGFVHHPGCYPDPIKVGEPMARLAPTGRYVHVRCVEQELGR